MRPVLGTINHSFDAAHADALLTCIPGVPETTFEPRVAAFLKPDL